MSTPASARMRRLRATAVLLVALALLLVPQALASSNSLSYGSTGSAVTKLQRKLHVRATGYYGNQTRAAVKRFQKRHGLKADGIAGPATLRALGVSARGASYSTGGASPESTSTSSRNSSSGSSVKLPATLKRIAQCESGGNPRAISSSGRYRGKFQFDMATWKAIGGKGDPAAAPESVQDRLALKLYRKRGTAPWPNCA